MCAAEREPPLRRPPDRIPIW